jgi:hypothetical protein
MAYSRNSHLHSFGSDFVKWSASEKGKFCSAIKLLHNVSDSDNVTLDDFLSSTKLVILLVFEDASTAVA